jgi:hypothetical protein
LEAEPVQTQGALFILQSKKKLAAERRQQTNLLQSKDNEKWIEDYVERETAVDKKQVEDAKTAIKQEQNNTTSGESGRLTCREPRQMIEEILDPIGDCLSHLPSFDDKQDGEVDEDTEQGKLSEDDDPGLEMGIISKTDQQCME